MRFKQANLFLIITMTLLFLFGFDWQKNKSKYWINTDYIKCLTDKLPCECEKTTKSFFYITLDTNEMSKSYGAGGLRYSSNELEQLDIKKQGNSIYKIYEDVADTNSMLGTVYIKGDDLFFIDIYNQKSTFVNFEGTNTMDNFQYYKQNIILLNKSFLKRGYSTIEKIIGDSLSCYCNKELGGLNIVISNNSHKTWIIEQNNDSVFLYNFLNTDDKSIPLKINKELIYKW